jgi:hypothetical protein
MNDAIIETPSDDNTIHLKEAETHHHSRLKNLWCTMDGLKLKLECSNDDNEQNRFFIWWTCEYYIGVVLVFCPNRTIPICSYNVPRLVHNSATASIGAIYNKLEEVFNRAQGGLCH